MQFGEGRQQGHGDQGGQRQQQQLAVDPGWIAALDQVAPAGGEAEARKVAAAAPIDAQKETVAFCNTGHWAATNWFALSEVAGQKNVSLYAGSMVDWTQDSKALPMDNVPSRVKQLAIDAKLWSDKVAK